MKRGKKGKRKMDEPERVEDREGVGKAGE